MVNDLGNVSAFMLLISVRLIYGPCHMTQYSHSISNVFFRQVLPLLISLSNRNELCLRSATNT